MTATLQPAAAARPASVTVGEIMRPGIVSCARTASAHEIAEIMRSCDVRCVAVLSNGHGVDPHPLVWGLVGDLDLMRDFADDGIPSTADDLARTPVVRIHPHETLAIAARVMTSAQVSHLIVIDGVHRTPIGVVSAHDIAVAMAARPD